MFCLFFGLFFIIIQAVLIGVTNVNIWPELYFFPYLIQKGLVPYRDFFDHHGFLLYYLLAPFSNWGTFFPLKLIYGLVLSVNLLFVLALLRKLMTRAGFILGGMLAVFLNYFVGENNFWYETVITTFYLAACFMLVSKDFRYKTYFIGILIAFVSFIKPTAGIIIVPLFLIKRDFRMVAAFLFCWLAAFSYFLINNAFSHMIEGLFLFNNFLARNYRPHFFSDWKFLLSSSLLVLFSVFLAWKNRRLKVCLFPLSFLISSLIFLSTGYDRTRLLPLFTFFAVLAVLPFSYRQTWQKTLFVLLLLGYMAFLGRKVLSHREYLNSRRIPWQEDERIKKASVALSDVKAKDRKLYIFSNHPEIYMMLGQSPPTYFPLKFPFTEKYFPDFEKRLISDIAKNRVSYIVIPKPVEEEYLKLNQLRRFIMENYSPVKETEQYEIRTYSN